MSGAQQSAPQRLGGDDTRQRSMTPQQAAADAAERRARDDIWCEAVNRGDSRAASVGEKRPINLVTASRDGAEDDDDVEIIARDVSAPVTATTTVTVPEIAQVDTVVTDVYSTAEHVDCIVCTLRNAATAVNCAACGTPLMRAEERAARDVWICRRCTLRNAADRSVCSVCETSRSATATCGSLTTESWLCTSCNFLNMPNMTYCVVCRADRK
jgi:hypothetical protein